MRPVAFLSYARSDNELQLPKHKIPQLALKLQSVVRAQMGDREGEFSLFVDSSLSEGQKWSAEIEEAINNATVFIPVLSPNYFSSDNCRREFSAFYGKLADSNQQRHLLPLLFRDIPKPDQLSQTALAFQVTDWRELRKFRLESYKVTSAIETLAKRIVELHQMAPPQPLSPKVRTEVIEAYSGKGGNSPREYFPEEVLALLEPGDCMFIVGRTCHSWFFSTKGSLSQHIESAIKKGVKLTFVVQDLHADVLATPDSITIPELTKHLTAVEQEFKKLHHRLGDGHKYGLKLLYTSVPIRRSRVLHFQDGNDGKQMFVRLQYDLSMKSGLKPFVVVHDRDLVEDVVAETESIIRNAMTEEQFRLLRESKQRQLEERLREKILAAWQSDPSFSVRRKNQPVRLIRQACAWKADDPPPPLCVQFLISNQCSTNCPMCTYFVREGIASILSLPEMKELLTDVRSMGTRSVVLSGGEPLAYPDFSSILQFARDIGIRIGLLTNGIFPEGTSDTTRNHTLNTIVEACEWIQVSVDSLEEEGYPRIRKRGTLDAVRGFLDALVERRFKNIDVCFTIQKGNYQELKHQKFFDTIRDQIPAEVYFRLKFAHATGGPNDSQFLIPQAELDELYQALTAREDYSRSNRKQIVRIMSQPNATENIAGGKPMQALLHQLSGNKARCRVMEAMMFIDCNGDVYPCCYTFNDNVAHWDGREKFKIGSWLSVHNDNPKANALQQLWRSKPFGELRNKALPIHDDACARCTRHLQQNEFLYRVQKAVEHYVGNDGDPRRLDTAIRGIEDPADERCDPIWL